METERRGIKIVSKILMLKTKFAVYSTTAIYLIIILGISYIRGELSGLNAAYSQMYEAMRTTGELFMPAIPRITPAAGALCLLLTLMQVIINAGYNIMCLNVSRAQKTDFKILFAGFDFPIKVLLIALLQTICVSVGLVLFIFPGIVMLYSFRMAYFVLADNPEYSAVRCLSESRRIMRYNRIKIFFLDVSFIGWTIISNLISLFFIPIVDVWLLPYRGVSLAVYYNTFLDNEFAIKMLPVEGENGATLFWKDARGGENEDKTHDDEGEDK